jgi:hypothetical protein
VEKTKGKMFTKSQVDQQIAAAVKGQQEKAEAKATSKKAKKTSAPDSDNFTGVGFERGADNANKQNASIIKMFLEHTATMSLGRES